MPQVVDLRKTKKIKVETEQPENQNIAPTKIEWVAPEFIKYKKGKKWFITAGLIALTILIIAVLTKNFLLAVATIFASLAVYVYSLKEPREIKFSISGKGVQIDNQIHRFENLKSFWIFYDPPEVKELSIRSKKTFIPYIRIPLDDQNPAEIRKFLLRFLPERIHKESIIEILARKARF